MMMQTRRDDLESFLYTFLFMLDVELPWNPSYAVTSKSQRIKEMRRKKAKLTDEQLEKRLPVDFRRLFRMIRSTKFDEEPNYKMI